MDKKVSVIIPVYNAEATIERCLMSIVRQTLPDIEIIIVDTGSVDSTDEIITKFKEEFPEKIIYIKLEEGNRAIARNKGFTKVTSEFFMFVDCDDYLELDACEKLYQEAMKSNYDIVTCDGYFYHLATDYKDEANLYKEFTDSEEKNYMVSNFKPYAKLFNTYYWKSNNIKFHEDIEYEDLALIPSLITSAHKMKHISIPLYNILQRRMVVSDLDLYVKNIKDIYKALVILESTISAAKRLEEYGEEIEYLYVKHLLYESTAMFLKCDNYKVELDKIVALMKQKFPHFKWNTYYVQREFKFRIACSFILKRRYKLVKRILHI